MDSPRGRILLMDMAERGERPLTPDMVAHWDACLGCLACLPACPSGVRYDQLLEATRQQVERRFRRPLPQRLWRTAIFSVLPHPVALRISLTGLWIGQATGLSRRLSQTTLTRRLPAELQAMARLAPPIRLPEVMRGLPAPRRPAARGPARLRVGLLGGCVQRVLEPHVNQATAAVLAAYGAEVRVPPGQGCCGALELHAGRESAALGRARHLIAHFEDSGLDRIAVNAAGCGAMLRTLDRLLAGDPLWAPRAAALAGKIRDITEILDELGPPDTLRPLPLRAAYHDACHLAHAQGVRDSPRRVLRAIPGLELLEVPAGDICCGSAGTYNLTQADTARDLGRRKAANIQAVGPQCVAAGNPGCLLQIRAAMAETGFSVPAFHPVELIAASLAGTPVDALLAGAK
jgi:glycolate oxidase iron-sulfur subunit